MTGLIKFDDSGFRSDISLEILSITEDGVDVVSDGQNTYTNIILKLN